MIDFSDLISPTIVEFKLEMNLGPCELHYDLGKADDEQYTCPVEKKIDFKAYICSFGSVHSRSDESYSFSIYTNSNTGKIYYVPCIEVNYTYKEKSYSWAFMISPNCSSDNEHTPAQKGNSTEEDRNKYREQLEKLNHKDEKYGILSAIFGVLIGFFLFYHLCDEKYQEAKRRLNRQIETLVPLRYKLKRLEHYKALGNEGANLDDIDEFRNEKTLTETEATTLLPALEGSDSETYEKLPQSVVEIDEYFEETNSLCSDYYAVARKFFNWLFVAWAVAIVVVTVKCVSDNAAEKRAIEQSISTEVTRWERRFHEEFVGKQFISDFTSDKILKISIIDTQKLIYQIGKKSGNILEEHINWSNPKQVTYNISVNASRTSYKNDVISDFVWTFDGYTCSDLKNEYQDDEFQTCFSVSNSESQYSFHKDNGIEIAEIEKKQKKLQDVFEHNIVGKTFESSKYSSELLRVTIKNNSTLEYQIGKKEDYIGDITWGSPKQVSYTISIDYIPNSYSEGKYFFTWGFADYICTDLEKALKDNEIYRHFHIKKNGESKNSIDNGFDFDLN